MKPFVRRKNYGRTPRRDGASVQGHLSTWTQSVVDQWAAERAKFQISDRATDLYTNDAMAHGLLESLVVEAVGVGLTPQFSPGFAALGQDQSWSDRFSAQMEKHWSAWALDCRCWCDAQRRLDIYGLQQLMYFCWKLSGIGIAQLRWKKDGFRPSPLAALPIDPSRLVTPSDARDLDIFDGVEVDEDGAPARVWLVNADQASATALSYRKEQCTAYDVWDAKTGLPKILLVSSVRNIAEYRQDSILAPMIEELRNNRDFVGAALVRAMISNMFVMFVENAVAQKKDADDWQNRVVELERGTILQGSQREIPHFFKAEGAPNGYREMFDSIVDRLGMATSRGSENVSRKYQASYSASKASMVKADQVNSVEHMTLVNRFCQPLLMWMAYERAVSGALDVPSVPNLAADLYWLTQCRWMPQPLPEIDRKKRADAIKTELDSGQLTYAALYGGQSKDWKKERRQRAMELAYDRSLESEFDITFSPTPDAPAQDTPAPEGSDLETV